MNLKVEILLVLVFFSVIVLNKLLWKKERNYNNILIIVMCICTAINVKIGSAQPYFDESRSLYIPLAVFVIAIVAITTIKYNSIKVTFDQIILLIILLSILLSYNNGQIKDMSKFCSIVALYLSIFFIGLIYKNLREYNLKRVLDVFSYMAIFNGCLSIVQYITNKKLLIGVFNDTLNYGTGVNIVKRVVGIAGSSNAAGNLGALLFSITLFNYLRTKKKIHLFAFIVNGIFLGLTLTRIGYLAAFVEVVIFLLFSGWHISKTVKKRSVVSWSIFTVLILGLTCGKKIYSVLFSQRGNTTTSRYNQYYNVFKRIMPNNTFWNGIGVGQYRYYSFQYQKRLVIDIHSQYLNVLAEQGMFIFILFIILNVYIFIKALYNTENRLEKAFVISLFIGNLICCNFNPNQYYTINNLLYYLLMYCYVYKSSKNIGATSGMIKIKLLNIIDYLKKKVRMHITRKA
ncbi:O-antigen ligase family protein [Clostridium psychrophilum]|uniref:O-antigen ligase family protein n=1 Tax=Clostridium psychrophilum TaxID=132926 RepID=UPI001C0B31BF|nr:O-antigen ligase family protein [Clostridium psychrophilum]MBU3180723.1 O-antigen ligase family protein [Clostridium psychrophilum]